MKKLGTISFVFVSALLTSCVSSEKFSMVVSEREILEQRVEELEEEVARMENLIFFLETEIRYVVQKQDDKK
jgi:predicted  nucleic acid-binding Zn-ribbon protein